MHEDTTGGTGAGREMVPGEDRADERWLFWTSGMMGRAALVGGTGALLLLCGFGGIVAMRAIAAGSPVPWVEPALFAAAAAAAIAGMIIVARTTSGGSVESAAGAPAAPQFPLRSPQPAEPGTARAAGAPLTRLQIDTRGGTRVVAATEVEWIEASGNYARLHLPDGAFLYRMPLARLERELDGSRFLRVHRSAIVNVDAIQRVEPLPSGDADVRLASGAQVRLSRRYAKEFHRRTGRPS